MGKRYRLKSLSAILNFAQRRKGKSPTPRAPGQSYWRKRGRTAAQRRFAGTMAPGRVLTPQMPCNCYATMEARPVRGGRFIGRPCQAAAMGAVGCPKNKAAKPREFLAIRSENTRQ